MSCACVQESREQIIQREKERERESSQRNEQRSYIFRPPPKNKKKLHLLNLTPSDLRQELWYLINARRIIHVPSLENEQFTTVCPDLCIRCSVTFQHSPHCLNPRVQQQWCSSQGWHRWQWCQPLVFFFLLLFVFLIQFRTIQRLYVRWTRGCVCGLHSL